MPESFLSRIILFFARLGDGYTPRLAYASHPSKEGIFKEKYRHSIPIENILDFDLENWLLSACFLSSLYFYVKALGSNNRETIIWYKLLLKHMLCL